MRILALFSIALLLAAPATAQFDAERIEIACTQAVLDQMTISDVDFGRSTTPKWLFTIELRTLPTGSSMTHVYLVLSGDLHLSTGETATDVIRLTTPQFTVNGTKVITNIDLARMELRADYQFDDEKISDVGVKDVALATSRLPAGIYTIRVEAYREVGGNITDLGRPRSPIVYDLRNPSSVELLLPADGDDAIGPFPLFQWLYDGAESRIAIFEKLPGQGSLEETVGGVAHVSQTVRGNSYQYPTGGVRSLRPGATYVWFVEGLSRSSGGTSQPVRSPLRSFAVTSSGKVGPEQSILDLLELTLGPEYKPLFDQIRANELTESGLFRLNDTTLTMDQLLQLLSALRRSPELVRGARIE